MYKFDLCFSQAHLETQTSKMELFVKIVNNF